MKLPGQTMTVQQAAASKVDELDFLACSGARTVSVANDARNSSTSQEVPSGSHWESNDFQQGQELQLNSGFADSTTSLVTITIGGNDARFADVITYCSHLLQPANIHNCSDPGQVMPGDKQDLRSYEQHVIKDLLYSKLVATYSAIHTAAPNAVILVGGYPRIFTPAGADGLCLAYFPQGDKLWINSMGALMNTTIQSAIAAVSAKGVKIHYVDPQSYFNGHEVCTANEYFNEIDLLNQNYSFHPNADGQSAYAAAFTASAAIWLK